MPINTFLLKQITAQPQNRIKCSSKKKKRANVAVWKDLQDTFLLKKQDINQKIKYAHFCEEMKKKTHPDLHLLAYP